MEVYGELLAAVIDFMKTEFTLFGFMVSYWQMFIFTCIISLVGLVIDGVFKS